MANNKKDKKVRIGSDGTIYIDDEPQQTGTGTGATTGPGTGATTGPGTGTTTGSGTGTTTGSGTGNGSSDDSDMATSITICAIIGAIACYFSSPTDDAVFKILFGATAGAASAWLPRLSMGFWISALVLIALIGGKPDFTFFQTGLPVVAMIMLFVCMGLLRYNAMSGAWEGWVEGWLFILAGALLAISVGIIQFDYSTPIIGPMYEQMVAGAYNNEEAARKFAKQYYTNALVDSGDDKKVTSIPNWEKRVRAYLEPNSPAEEKFDRWLASTPEKGLDFISTAEETTATTHGDSVAVTVEYRGTQNPGSYLSWRSESQTIVCEMSDKHFVRDYNLAAG